MRGSIEVAMLLSWYHDIVISFVQILLDKPTVDGLWSPSALRFDGVVGGRLRNCSDSVTGTVAPYTLLRLSKSR